jgi:hypothetical protein
MSERNAQLSEHVAGVGDPLRAPYGVFGLPSAKRPEHLKPHFSYGRFQTNGLDAVIVDLTKSGRSELGDDWQKRLEVLVDALQFAPGRRPPIVIITDDVFVFGKAVKSLRARGALQRPPRKRCLEMGALLLGSGLFGNEHLPPSYLSPLKITADIKDASLAPLRKEALRIGHELSVGGHRHLAEGVSEALGMLRRVASLPLGLKEASATIDILFDADDEVHARIRSLFRPKMALARLATVADHDAALGDASTQLRERIETKLLGWADETPVSLKLAAMLQQAEWNSPATLISTPDARVSEAYLASDRAVNIAAEITDHHSLSKAFEARRFKQLIALSPTPELVRSLLVEEHCPQTVAILGDAAGTALVVAQLRPLTRIAAFQPLAERAQAILHALERGGSDESLDVAEVQFRVTAAQQERNIDFTQAGEAWEGDTVEVATTRVARISYRPTSDVLAYSPGETRPFERKSARDVRRGDHILVLDSRLREPLRQALAGSKKALGQLKLYHDRMNLELANQEGISNSDKARRLAQAMRDIDPTFGGHEDANVLRWITAGQVREAQDGTRQPRAARDKSRFDLFMKVLGVDQTLADLYWFGAITPSRAYRALEGYLFNQRVVQFVLDPEGTVGSSWSLLHDLWQRVIEAVDEVSDVTVVRRNRNG